MRLPNPWYLRHFFHAALVADAALCLELALMAKQGRAGIGGRQKGLGLSHGQSGAAHKIVKKRDLSGKLTQKAPVSLVDKDGKPFKSVRKAELAARKERRSRKAAAATNQ